MEAKTGTFRFVKDRGLADYKQFSISLYIGLKMKTT